MSIPLHRRLLSYLTEQVLETTRSEYNDFLQVCLVAGRLQLVAEEAIYSFGDYYLNFRKLFERFDFDRLPERSEVLILGLGLGSIIDLLENRHGLAYSYVAVEIDPVIVDLAAEYALPNFTSPVEVVEADAGAFLRLDERAYDLICVDIFQDATVPKAITEPEFLSLLSARLNPGGVIIFNRLADTSTHRHEAKTYFERVFLEAFPGGGAFDSGGNLLLVSEGKIVRP